LLNSLHDLEHFIDHDDDDDDDDKQILKVN